MKPLQPWNTEDKPCWQELLGYITLLRTLQCCWVGLLDLDGSVAGISCSSQTVVWLMFAGVAQDMF